MKELGGRVRHCLSVGMLLQCHSPPGVGAMLGDVDGMECDGDDGKADTAQVDF